MNRNEAGIQIASNEDAFYRAASCDSTEERIGAFKVERGAGKMIKRTTTRWKSAEERTHDCVCSLKTESSKFHLFVGKLITLHSLPKQGFIRRLHQAGDIIFSRKRPCSMNGFARASELRRQVVTVRANRRELRADRELRTERKRERGGRERSLESVQ